MLYRDFIIRIGEARDDAYTVHAESNAGEVSGTFEIPFTEAELAPLRCGQLPAQAPTARPDAPLGAKEIGKRLFRALFRDAVGSLFDRSLGEVETSPDLGLRIKLKFDLRRAERLAGLPWELLHRLDTGEYLALNRQTPVVRYLEVQQRRVSPMALPERLRILAVVSPAGDLDLEREEHYLERAFKDSDHVEITFVHAPTLEALRQRLLDEEFHVLHFMGHGRHTGRGGQLVFADKSGVRNQVSGSTLADQLRGVPALRLVFLNTCQSAQNPNRKASDPFAGVASALVRAGVPAVLAMQHRISDSAATTFSQAFYQQLAKGAPIDTASVEGRLAVQRADADAAEWCLPVLFMRVADGQLFQTNETQTGEAPLPLLAATLPSPAVPATAHGLIARRRLTRLQIGIALVVLLGSLLFLIQAPWRTPESDRGLILSEVFYDAPDKDDQLEWVELYNAGSKPIDLAGYSIGAGGEDFTKTLIPLIGKVEPGRTFVVGGPRSTATNGHPAFDQEREIVPDLQNGSKSGKADGVALFAVSASEVTSSTWPLDAVIYGAVNANHLIDETGVAPQPHVSLGPTGSSIERIDLEKGWVLRSQPTPNTTPLNTDQRPR